MQNKEAHNRDKANKRDWYRRNTIKVNAAVAKRKKELAEFIAEYKKDKFCINCGFSHPAALDFHHRNPTTKIALVSQMPNYGWSLAKIKEEIDKCDILCANCHRILHYNQKI